MAKTEDTEDVDLEKENNVDEEENEDEEADDSADESSEDDGEEDESEDDISDDDEEIADDAVVTGKSFKALQKSIMDKLGVLTRHSMKNSKTKITKQPKFDNKSRDNLANDVASLKESDRKRQFGYENNLSPEETDLVFQFNRNPSKKTLKHPFVSGGLEKLRSKKRLDANMSSGATGRTFKVNGKDWKDLTPEERAVNFRERQKAILAGRR